MPNYYEMSMYYDSDKDSVTRNHRVWVVDTHLVTFGTRREAREALKQLKNIFPRAAVASAVVRVDDK